MQDLIKHFETQFEKYTFTNKFKNEDIEEEYKMHFHRDIIALCRIALGGACCLGVVLILWCVVRDIQTNGNYFRDGI